MKQAGKQGRENLSYQTRKQIGTQISTQANEEEGISMQVSKQTSK